MKIAVTGPNGFIGAAVVDAARRAGHQVTRLARRGAADSDDVLWSLGEPLPSAAADADVLIHLASAVLGSSSPQKALELDVEGARRLIEDARRLRRGGGGPRFLFVSSQSADPEAANAYGRSKWLIETLLVEPEEIIVRPGLVYGQPPRSVYAALARLAALPVVPVVRGPAAIHPIHVDDLAECLVQVACLENPSRLWSLGAAPAMTLAEVLAGAAREAGRTPPLTVPAPRAWVRAAAASLDFMFRPAQSLLERVDGLIGLKPMDPAPSLAHLGRTLRTFGTFQCA